jgi:hypothetical protein
MKIANPFEKICVSSLIRFFVNEGKIINNNTIDKDIL